MQYVGLIVVLVVAFLLRLPLLNQSFWLDEAAQALESMRPLGKQFQIAYDFQPPLFHLVAHFFTQISTSEWFLRLVPLSAGLLTIVVTYFIGKELGGKQSKHLATGSALLLAVSPFHIYFSQELRPYSFAALFGTLSWYMLLRWQKSKESDAKAEKQWGIAYVLSAFAGVFSMYVTWFSVFAQIGYVFVHQKKSFKKFLLLPLSVFAINLLWLPSFLEQLSIGSALRVQLPGWSSIVSPPQWKALFLVAANFLGGVVRIDPTWQSVSYFGALFVCIGLTVYFTYRSKKFDLKQHSFLLWWLLGSVFMAWVCSFFVQVLSPKRALFALPALFLLIKSMLLHIRAPIRTYLFVALVALQCVGIVAYWMQPALQREGWREAIAHTYTSFSPEDTIVVFGFNEPYAPWTFYTNKTEQRFETTHFVTLQTSANEEELNWIMMRTEGKEHVLIFDYLRDLTDPQRKIESWLVAHGYEGVDSIDTRNLGFIRHYSKVK